MDKQREKLIELIREAEKIEAISAVTGSIEELIDAPRGAEAIADHLLANGVIVPPVKVGQTVYVVNSLWVSEYTVEAVWWDGLMFQFKAENEEYADECSVFYFFDERIGKTVFLSREDAEKALRGRSDDN